jgi:hypothetical protein
LFVDEIILGLSGSAPLGSFDLRGYSGYELVVLGSPRPQLRKLSHAANAAQSPEPPVHTPNSPEDQSSSITPIRGVEDPTPSNILSISCGFKC